MRLGGVFNVKIKISNYKLQMIIVMAQNWRGDFVVLVKSWTLMAGQWVENTCLVVRFDNI